MTPPNSGQSGVSIRAGAVHTSTCKSSQLHRRGAAFGRPGVRRTTNQARPSPHGVDRCDAAGLGQSLILASNRAWRMAELFAGTHGFRQDLSSGSCGHLLPGRSLTWAKARGAATTGLAAFTVVPRCSPPDLVRLWCVHRRLTLLGRPTDPHVFHCRPA